jgi:extracellular matrix regulatory protein A
MAGKGVLNIGFGNLVIRSRLVAILTPGTNPVRRLRDEAREAGRLVDATHGRKCRAVLVCDSGHLILSAVQPETLCQRYEASDADATES